MQKDKQTMDLICTEQVNLDENEAGDESRHMDGSFVQKADQDPIFLNDRCFENLLKAEDKHTAQCSYFDTVQKDITPKMRKLVAEWVIDVSRQFSKFSFVLTFLNRFFISPEKKEVIFLSKRRQ